MHMATGKNKQFCRWYVLPVLVACSCALGLTAGTALAAPGVETGGGRERSAPRELLLQVVTDTPTYVPTDTPTLTFTPTDTPPSTQTPTRSCMCWVWSTGSK